MASVTPRRTKIVATIGPACSTLEKFRELVEAGMDAARLNLSHGTQEDHAARAKLVREVQEEIGRPLALIGDLQGPKVRVGGLDQPLNRIQWAEVTVVTSGEGARDGELVRELSSDIEHVGAAKAAVVGEADVERELVAE